MRRPGEERLVVFFGHHKCATSWIDRILMKTSAKLGRTMRIVHRDEDLRGHEHPGAMVCAEGVDVLALTNARREWVSTLPPFRGFHVIRDPRDLVVSAYFSHVGSHGMRWPALEEHRAVLRRLDKDAGLSREIVFSAQFLDAIAGWDYTNPDICELRFEDLVGAQTATMLTALEFVGLVDPRPESRRLSLRTVAEAGGAQVNHLMARAGRALPSGVPSIPPLPVHALPQWLARRFIDRQSFARLTGGRAQGTEMRSSHYRKGSPGDWVDHLESQHLAALEERYGDLTESRGYGSWTTAASRSKPAAP